MMIITENPEMNETISKCGLNTHQKLSGIDLSHEELYKHGICIRFMMEEGGGCCGSEIQSHGGLTCYLPVTHNTTCPSPNGHLSRQASLNPM